MSWMAWTWQSEIFFGFIAASLALLTVLAIFRPETPRRGVLRFKTTRGDRFFVSLIAAAYLFIAWIRLGGGTLWIPLAGACLLGGALFRYA